MPNYLNQIPEAGWTHWERAYNAKRPYHFYKIREGWDALDRDFMAYWNGRLQDALEEYGHPSARPVVEIDRWLAPIVRGDVDPTGAPDEHWQDYDKATTGGGGVRSVRKHVDGRILNERGEAVGRWDDNEDGIRQWATAKGLDADTEVERRLKAPSPPASTGNPLIDQVLTWAAEQPGTDHEDRWLRAAAGMGLDNGHEPMTAREASEHSVRFWAKRWDPVARAIRDREIDFTGGSSTAEAQLEETLKVINARPDVEVRKYNPETETLEVLSPVTVTQPVFTVAPEYQDGFIEYLQVERGWAEANNGKGHPVVKHDVFGKMIEMVKAGESGSDIKNQYDQFLNWMDGKFGQSRADGSIREFQSAEAKAAAAQLEQREALRKAIPGDNAALAARTQEILEKAAKDAPTPADIAAAVAAGDWHKVAELAKAQAKAQTPPDGYVWFGWIRQGSVASGQYICIGDGEYEEAILYLASDFGGREPRPRLYQQNALNGPCRVRHSHDWNDCRREGPFLKTWEEIRAEYDNI